MKYTQQTSLTGAWVDKSKITSGMKAKIVSEAKSVPSTFKDKNDNIKNQYVAKVHFEGEKEAVNVSLNRATITGLISAFGDDSVGWQGHYLRAEVEKMRVAGKAVTALYLIPEGYTKIDDEEGYATIIKSGDVPTVKEDDIPVIDSELPF